VVCDKEGYDNSNKGNGNKGGWQAMETRVMATTMATMWVMATMMRLMGNKEGKGKRGKGDDDGNKGGG
jgi:hypothetical protein